MYQLLDGKKLATTIIDDVGKQIAKTGLQPQLAVILVGDDSASQLYVKLKEKACKKVGIGFHKYVFNNDISEKELMKIIAFLNNDDGIHAILIQLPLPKQLNQDTIIKALDYRKDVDGFHKTNIDRYLAGKKQIILPGLALAIWNLISAAGEQYYKNKKALIIGKSEQFTLPTKKLLEERNIICEITSPESKDIKQKALDADIIVSAIGIPKSITIDMVKQDVVIIDVGINKAGNTVVGDVDFESVAPKTSYITPVPGGVGPMTVAMLLYNTVVLAQAKNETTIET